MKKIICGLAIVLCLCASVFAEPTEEQLAAKGIEAYANYNHNGELSYRYSEIEKLTVGKRYMLLNYNRTMELMIDDGSYNVALFEVISENDKNGFNFNGEYLRTYPSMIYWVPDESFKLGDIIVYTSLEDLFEKDYFTANYWFSTGWETKESELEIFVQHKVQQNVLLDVAKKPLYEQKGIEHITANDGNTITVYSKINDFESGKKYMCLDNNRTKNFSQDKNGYYSIYFYEIVDKTTPNAVKVGSKYILSYPSARVFINPKKKPKIPSEITFSNIESLFGMNWNLDITGYTWGWRSKDADLGIWVEQKVMIYRLSEK